MRKLIVAVADGMADLPLATTAARGGRTPLEVAYTPLLDTMARHSVTGLCHTVPPGLSVGTETALPALMGYAPESYPLQRGPLEALGLGVPLDECSTVWRLNIVSLDAENALHDFTAGNIDEASATRLLQHAQSVAAPSLHCVQGISFRHLLLQRQAKPCSAAPPSPLPPPHESMGFPLQHALKLLNAEPELAKLVSQCLAAPQSITPHGKKLMLWPWGQGKRPSLPLFSKMYGRSAAMVAGIPLAKGIARAAGMTVPDLVQCTGTEQTDYAAKAHAAIELLCAHDVVFVHLEATDLCGYRRHFADKQRAIEQFESMIIAPLRGAYPHAVLLCTCDHLTPVSTGAHHAGAVPFLLHDRILPVSGLSSFSEASAAATHVTLASGPALLRLALLRAEAAQRSPFPSEKICAISV